MHIYIGVSNDLNISKVYIVEKKYPFILFSYRKYIFSKNIQNKLFHSVQFSRYIYIKHLQVTYKRNN